ncbi:succinyldiaminopimelate transaminase [Sciscionella marina]|uniref:succinyldiaminopimelate transaminase n=1 Tax=Sciscionella marina TaxID=508770 RepID=UPI00036FB764|nr:succinyldiaminopimelate transaminase [Sciscionella marina]
MRLPDFPWDSLVPHQRTAAAHPDGIVDLSVGAPVDEVPAVLREGLQAGANLPGYPATHGTRELREAAVAALQRRFGITGLGQDAVLPTVGSKELVAGLPAQLGLGADDAVVIPGLAYPTYEVGACLAGADVLRAEDVTALGAVRPALVWLNSPANPTGRVAGVGELRAAVDWARDRGAVVASDECYLGLPWESEPVSVLHPEVCGGDHTGLLAVHSLSKTSNLAGYRAGFVTGDPELVARLLEIRKHAGLIMPHPVQHAVLAALRDDEHIAQQRERYRARRERLWKALTSAGFEITHSAAGLYLWASADENAWRTVERLAGLGILVAPGTFYGPSGDRHVRVSLTASDERIEAAAGRLS